jgi:hypothetical protein
MACGGCDSFNSLFTSINQAIVLFNTSHISLSDSGNIRRFVFLANAANYSALLKTKIFESNKSKLIHTESFS